MKATILSLLFLLTVNLPDGKAGAQNIWYVDRDATGANDGTSWEDAFRTMGYSDPYTSHIWTTVGPGDSIYVSGGTDSTEYLPQRIKTPEETPVTFSEQVVIAPAWQAGHNGDVYFVNRDTTKQLNFGIASISNIKMVNFNFMTLFETQVPSPGIGGTINFMSERDSLNTFENCNFTNSGSGGAVYMGSATKHTFTNCTIQTLTSDNGKDQDVLTWSGGRGGHTFTNCTIIQRNTAPTTTAHRDLIQVGSGVWGDDEYLQTTFENCFLWCLSPNAGNWNQGFFISAVQDNPHKQRLLLINNLMVIDVSEAHIGAVVIVEDDTTSSISVRMYNNTFITPNTTFFSNATDTLIAKNNLFIQTDPPSNTTALLLGRSAYRFYNAYIDMDNNYYAINSWDSDTKKFRGGNDVSFNWGEWQSLTGTRANFVNVDAHSDTGSINLSSVRDSVISAYITTTGRDAGVNLSSLFTTDIRNEPRPPFGPWDLGAIEVDGNPTNTINLKSKIFLQGPFSSNSMLTTLNQSGILPNSQPYNSPPWNYNGNENLGSGPNSTMVDWVLVELRSATNPNQVVARRAAILKNNGLLLETNGVEGVNFNNVDPGSYYIAIYHRNHLAIMSAGPVQLSTNSVLYDFSTAMNKAYGQNPMIELAPGKYGMYASDGNADGVINITDRDDVWLIENGNMGYLEGDFNMNSGVTVHDVNQFWNINNGAVTRVP